MYIINYYNTNKCVNYMYFGQSCGTLTSLAFNTFLV